MGAKMLQIAKLLLSLSAWLPIAKIVELVRAAGELPNFADSAAVQAWFARIGIAPPLADVLLALIAQFGSKLVGGELPEAVDEDDLAEQLASTNPGIDPATILAIIAAAREVVALIRQWRQNRLNPTPAPTPVV